MSHTRYFRKNLILQAGLTLNNELGGKEKTGFIFQAVTFKVEGKQEVESLCFGDPGEDTVLFNFFAGEKIHRLWNRRLKGFADTSSGESVDLAAQQYPGAIYCQKRDGADVYFSISGLMSIVDEAIAYTLAESLGMRVDHRYENNCLNRARELLRGCILD
jgi:hypothetical protein